MGRPLRLKAAGLTYHITSRTNGKRLFFKKKQDQKALCLILKQILSKYGVILYAFTPMMNHFHMLISIQNEADLSQVMCEIKTIYAKYFNKKYKISGHFWGDRFRSTIVQDDKHILTCLRYLDRNPVKAGLVNHPGKWLFSSFHSYAYGLSHPFLPLQPHPVYLALSKVKSKRRQFYLSLVIEPDTEADALHGHLHQLTFFGSREFVQEVKSRLN